MFVSQNKYRMALAALAFMLMLPLGVAAAPNNAPFALGTGSTKPSVAMDSKGTQYYVWWNPNTKTIQYSSCTGSDGSNCTATVDLPSHGASYYPGIALDGQGRPNVVFESKVSGSYQVFWTRLESNGWISPVQISSEPYSELPDIAIGPRGVIHVVYQSKQSGTGFVYYAENSNGSWHKPEPLAQVTSDKPLTNFAELAEQAGAATESDSLSNGLFPRVAADGNDRAHIVWNLPSPYGIRYRFQTSTGWSKTRKVAKGQKDQTPDVAVAPNGSVGIVWGTYDDYNAAFVEYQNGKKDKRINDIDGGLAQSLWPRLTADCAGNFQIVFQGKTNPSASWNIYRTAYNPVTNQLLKRVTIAALGAQEQTPAIAGSNNTVAVVWANTSYQTIYGGVTQLACP